MSVKRSFWRLIPGFGGRTVLATVESDRFTARDNQHDDKDQERSRPFGAIAGTVARYPASGGSRWFRSDQSGDEKALCADEQGTQRCSKAGRDRPFAMARSAPHCRLPMATARRQEHYGGFYLTRSFIGPSHRTTLCVLGIRKGGRLDFGPHKNRNSGRLICAERHYIYALFENGRT